jgi:hypothetical protein
MTDARWPNPASQPNAYFDVGGWAPYVEASAAFYTANFTTLAANWCTAQSTACALTPPFAPNCVGAVDATYCYPFILGIAGPASAELNTLVDLNAANARFKQALYSVGKSFVNYEGGGNWATCSTVDTSNELQCGTTNADLSHITTAAQRNYMIALYQSASWASVYSAYCQSRMSDTSAGGCGNLSGVSQPAPNFQFVVGSSPDLFGSTNTEGNGLIPLWASETTINTGQP